ncbi:MAG TPA: protein-glutamate O-methyltransferase CheR [Gemmatimonadaceae bacterium]|jgi:chemotaxis methyl-accepting protein methylase|nr:protein-glutamate O-methyltransferase CheR [Gemmatimonadaceae bacterium]
MSEVLSDPEFELLTRKISRDRNFGCASYKEKCLRRRIAVRMRARGVHTYRDYAHILDSDAGEYERLLDALTINVTKLFRNPETYAAIARSVIPPLWERNEGRVGIWSAGCSSGEEAYSLAILVHRHAAMRGQLSWLSRTTILGTDIDRASLVAAERGTYSESSFADTPPDLRAEYFSAQAPYAVRQEVKRMVRFERRDLLRDPAPDSMPDGIHLIACRNVIIYFDRSTQESLFRRFHDALSPGGYLVLGKVETLLGAARSSFATVEPRERIFRRP